MGRWLVVLGVVLAGCGGGGDSFGDAKDRVVALHWECYDPEVQDVGNLVIDESDIGVCTICVGAQQGVDAASERYPVMAESASCTKYVDACAGLLDTYCFQN